MKQPESITTRLVKHIVASDYQHMHRAAIKSTQIFILDSLGVALSGTRVPMVRHLKQMANSWGFGEAATIWGTGERVPAATAAFINSYQIHNQEWDCLHEPAVVHPMAVVLATLIAWAEARGGITGRELINACSVAIDVAAGIGCAARNQLRFFRPAMCGALGATAGIARLLKLDEHKTRSALGIAYSQLSGTMQAHLEGSAVLPMQISFNTRAALNAIDLVQVGANGPKDFLEGQFGYFNLIDPDWDQNSFDDLEQCSRVTELSHKPFPSGRATHGGIDGTLILREKYSFNLNDIQTIRVIAPPLVVQLVDRLPSKEMTPSYARLCLPYVVASALLKGNIDVSDFDELALRDPKRLELAKHVEVVRDQNPSLNALSPQRVEIFLKDGRSHSIDLPVVIGAPDRPLSHECHLEKFKLAAASGLQALPSKNVISLIDLINNLEDLTEIRELVLLMKFPPLLNY